MSDHTHKYERESRWCRCGAYNWDAAPELLRVAEGALGYLEALPASARPDEAWFAPLRAAIRLAKGEYVDDSAAIRAAKKGSDGPGYSHYPGCGHD